MSLDLLLYVFAFVLFVVAGVGVSSGRFNLIALGLACWVATFIFK
jgi:hypothetical protein